MSRPMTVVSLLVWDSPLYTRNLLMNLDYAKPGRNFHLRILDQGSQEETRSLVRDFVRSHNGTSAEILSGNIGYGAGHNRNYAQVAKSVDFDYFVTINSDLVFGEPNWLDTLVDAMEAEPEAAIGGPFAYCEHPGRISPATRTQCEAGDFMFITGAVSIMRAATVRQLGLFDEAYSPAYWEDADMVERYRHFGWRQKYIDLPVFHGYLGEAGRVANVKTDELNQKWGDFRQNTLRLFFDRWRFGNAPLPQDPADLPQCFPRLYIPQGSQRNP